MTTETALLDIKLLRLLDQLYTTRSVTRSAEALGQSQPTVSIWLARLRKELGDPLFVRTAEGMLPTPRTDALMGTVREVLAGLQRLAQAAAPFDPSTSQRRFSSCMNGAGFYRQTLYTQDWICLANAQHPRVAGDTPANWNLAVYQAEAHIGISSGTGYQLPGSAVASQHLTRRIRLELPGFLGLSAILSTSDLIATLPRHIGETLARATGHRGLRVLPCPFEIPGFTVKQYWHARYHHNADSRWLRGICAELFMKSASSADAVGARGY